MGDTESLAPSRAGIGGIIPRDPLCVLFTPHPYSQSQRVWALGHLGSQNRRKMNCTAPWELNGLKRSCRRLGPEEGRSQAAAMERKTLSVREQAEEGVGEDLTVQQRRGLGSQREEL